MKGAIGAGETLVVLFFSPVILSSAWASLLIFARPCVVPLRTAGVPTGWDGKRVHDAPRMYWIHGGDALERAQLMTECWSGCAGSLLLRNVTINIEASLMTTPENGHRLAVYDCVGFVKAIFTALGRENCIERRRCGEAGVKGALFCVHLDP